MNDTTNTVQARRVDCESASAYCGLGRTTLWRLRSENRIESVKVGAKVLVFLPSLDEYLHGLASEGGPGLLDDDTCHEELSGF